MKLARAARIGVIAALGLGVAGPVGALVDPDPLRPTTRVPAPRVPIAGVPTNRVHGPECGPSPSPGVWAHCVHGGDPAPPGAAIAERRSALELAADTEAGVVAATIPTTSCVGNGTDGKRVQAVYVVASDKTDRSADIVPLMRQWAGITESSFVDSAAQTGGVRRVRWVHDANCMLDVDVVVVGASADDTFGATISALQSAGYTSANRKYLLWVDANVYCGIAQLYGDDDASNNYNDGTFAMYARVDNGCWGYSYPSVEAHELMHNLGAVQASAPNHSPYGHCLDDKDTMCYADGPGVVVNTVCPGSENERLFDCNKDDYFSTNPAPGSYLATHWNTANSGFLFDGPASPAPDPDPDPPDGDPVVVTSYSWWSGQMTLSEHTAARKVTPTADGEFTVRLKFTGSKPARLRIYSNGVLIADHKQAGNLIEVTGDATANESLKFVIGADTKVKWILRAYYPTIAI
jgi:hypothetical protein